MSDAGKLARFWSLIVLILTGAGFVGLNWLGYYQFKPMIIPALAFTSIYILVLIFEVIGALFGYKKTLSTRWKHWATQHPVLSWTALGLFWIAMTALVIHLGVYW